MALICGLGRPVSELPLGCAEPEVMAYCDYTSPTLGHGGCSLSGGMPDLFVMAHTQVDHVPTTGDVMASAPRLEGAALSVEVRQKVAPAQVQETYQAWYGALEAWGCTAGENRYWQRMSCEGWAIDVRQDLVSSTVAYRAHLPDATRCLWHDPR